MRDALTAEPWGDSRLGLVGRITSVEQIGVRALLAGGIVPVIAPTASGLNVNADNAAAAVAGALGASELIFLSDVPGRDGAGRRGDPPRDAPRPPRSWWRPGASPEA